MGSPMTPSNWVVPVITGSGGDWGGGWVDGWMGEEEAGSQRDQGLGSVDRWPVGMT